MDDIEDELTVGHDFTEDETTNQERIKKPDLRVYTDDKGVRSTISFSKWNRRCVGRIRDAMLLHHWPEAALFYGSYIQTLEAIDGYMVHSTASEITWRLGTEILRHLPNASAEDFNGVYEQLKNNGVKNFSKICLEHCFHLMLNGELEEAKRQLSVGASWRYGNISTAQGDTRKIIHAHSGFLDYLTWCEKKSSAAATDEASGNHEMHSYFRQASVTLKDIISQPGVWDPFVLGYINMLEFYNDEEGALQILENYAYNKEFPINPNAHLYLYQFLKRHNAPQARLIGSLRILRTLVPSHELMLELCSLLLSTSLMSDLEEALSISMDLLEFSSWKCDTRAWACLLNILKILERKKCKETIQTAWDARYPLWFCLHFRSYIARRDMAKPRLMKLKREVLRVVNIYTSRYIRYFTRLEKMCRGKTRECTVEERELRKVEREMRKMDRELGKMERGPKKMDREQKRREKESKKMEKEKERENMKMAKERKKLENERKKKKMDMEKKKMKKKMIAKMKKTKKSKDIL